MGTDGTGIRPAGTGPRSDGARITAQRTFCGENFDLKTPHGGRPTVASECGKAALRSAFPHSEPWKSPFLGEFFGALNQFNLHNQTGHFICYKKRTFSLATDTG